MSAATTTEDLPIHGDASPSLEQRLAELEWHRSEDVDRRLVEAQRVRADADLEGDALAAMRAQLVVADMLHRTGETRLGAEIAADVHAWAVRADARGLLARSHLVLSSMFEVIGDTASTLDHAVRALDLLHDDDPPRTRGNHLLRLGDALALDGSADAARRRYHEASELFAEIGDRERLLNVLNNLAVLESETNDPHLAAVAAQVLDDHLGDDVTVPDYVETIARARLVAGDLVAAERAVLSGQRLLGDQGGTKAVAPAEMSLTLAEILLAQGRLDDAQEALDRCRSVCDRRRLSGVAVAALDVQAKLHAAAGRFEAAYLTLREVQAASASLRSQQHEAAAHTREALFRTAEAQRDAERFRQQARSDALTGLPNRRAVDEVIPRWLTQQVSHGPVIAAIVDVDHFKRINDRWTHQVGDEVLCELAHLLRAATGEGASEGEIAARIGGEEFAVLLRGVDPTVALERLEQVRSDVALADWEAIAPGLRVTISVGVAVSEPDDDQSSLLRRADEQLYRAKAAGRDRMMSCLPMSGEPIRPAR